MTKFRKKPVVIEAVQFKGTPKSALDVGDVFDIEGMKFKPSSDLEYGDLMIPTLEGNMLAKENDWIIKGVNGEFYPCKPDIFEKTYDAVDDAINVG